MSSFSRLLKSKWNPPAMSDQTFPGKTVLITGGTSGLGLEAAKKIAALDVWTLIITARDEAKGQLAKEEIEFICQERAMDDLDIQVWPLDMSDLSSVKKFADRVDKELPRLDVAILNAGQSNRRWKKSAHTAEPWEMTVLVNTLATVYLALLLLPKLLGAARSKGADPADTPHLTFISSGAVTLQKPEKYEYLRSAENVIETASKEGNYQGEFGQYSVSKVFMEYAMRRIAVLPSISKDSGEKTVIVNSTCPGLCETGLGKSSSEPRPLIFRFLLWIFFALFARTAEEGSRSYISGVQQGPEGQGKMWKNDKYQDPGPIIESDFGKELGNKAWHDILEVLTKSDRRIEDIITMA